ncbi:MAG: hypothetical protein HY288_09445 [Planctomycetia bacterium]|nr:hypothetical protein [Planctomycetia bacterium]
MAKKQASAKGANKSDTIREILSRQPKATVKEIKVGLQERGVKASDALINKIKQGRNRSKAGAKKSRARRNETSPISKADAIRGMLRELGVKARPRDVILALATRGVVVSSAQVSGVRKTLSRHRNSPAGRVAGSVSLDHLMAAKVLAKRLGGIEIAQHALASLAKIMEN